MFAVKMECELGVIYFGRFPAIRNMAGFALRSELPGVRIILEMAGGAVLRRAFEDTVDMTFLACHSCMLAIEMECEFGMIHLGRFPSFRSMTGGTICSKLPVMEIILLMTGITLLGCGLHVSDGAVIKVTVGAGCQSVFTDQFEWESVMVEVRTVRVNSIVTSHAVRPECQEVLRCKCLVNL
jgi:hypothetical protein